MQIIKYNKSPFLKYTTDTDVAKRLLAFKNDGIYRQKKTTNTHSSNSSNHSEKGENADSSSLTVSWFGPSSEICIYIRGARQRTCLLGSLTYPRCPPERTGGDLLCLLRPCHLLYVQQRKIGHTWLKHRYSLSHFFDVTDISLPRVLARIQRCICLIARVKLVSWPLHGYCFP